MNRTKTVGEKHLSVGIVSSIQTHGSLANWHPHLHLLVTDGGFRPDGTFVRLPRHDVAMLTEGYCQLKGTRVKSTPGVAGFAQAVVAALHSLKERSRSNR